ncbi:unnamed protein product [Strongylus vulgaris]|uniref:Uncharacterized protein n=1 Tax=Strongylus vulgaris TaxID=40348 RepID=A0A3P7L8X7_STRVU|nr:unnamed protein product [Strongylus vulgaris]
MRSILIKGMQPNGDSGQQLPKGGIMMEPSWDCELEAIATAALNGTCIEKDQLPLPPANLTSFFDR